MGVKITRRSQATALKSRLPAVDAGLPARRLYRLMVDEQIAPVLAGWGFTRDGDVFTYPSQVWMLMVGLVPSRLATTQRHGFTVHVVAVTHGAWQQWRDAEPELPERPEPGVYYAQDFAVTGGLRNRLSDFTRRGRDREAAVRTGEDPTSTAIDVLTQIRTRVLPQFQGRAEGPIPGGGVGHPHIVGPPPSLPL